MLWNVLMVLGVLFIINGMTISRHTRALEMIRKKMGKNTEIYSGMHKGLFFLSSTDVMLDVGSNGAVRKAFGIKSGWLRKTTFEEIALGGINIAKLDNHMESLSPAEKKACMMAARQYEIRNRKKQ